MSLLNLTIPEYCDLTKKHKLKSFVLMPQASEFTAALAHNRMGFSNEMVSSESDSGSCIDASMIDRDNRFVAGAKFFNYKQLGALREGGEVSLFLKTTMVFWPLRLLLARCMQCCDTACDLPCQALWVFISLSLHSAHFVLSAYQHR